MKFSYKEKQDLIWSLEKNAERLAELGREEIDHEYRRLNLGEELGVMSARERYKKIMASWDRMKALQVRIKEEVHV